MFEEIAARSGLRGGLKDHQEGHPDLVAGAEGSITTADLPSQSLVQIAGPQGAFYVLSEHAPFIYAAAISKTSTLFNVEVDIP